MIQQGTNKHKPALIALWKQCFPDDTDLFINLYFNKLYKNEEALIAVENDRPVAFLQMLPCEVKIDEKQYPARYIYGVMTHPKYRRKGYMHQLLTAALSQLDTMGADCGYAFLIPQTPELARTYAKYGFFNCEERSTKHEELPVVQIIPSAPQRMVALQDYINEGGTKFDGDALIGKSPGMLRYTNDYAPAVSGWEAFMMLD
ncbi:acetyltransferase, GNAT family [Candidatus Symbiothrix dinenymphae]|nr:acetyltransferase, GNAT family [Candidatus Symbiothrix dinenymphae]